MLRELDGRTLRLAGAAIIIAVAATCTATSPRLTVAAADGQDVEHAWAVLQTGLNEKSLPHRVAAVRALGVLQDDARGRDFAEKALADEKEEVRAAAATSLGNMNAKESVEKLRVALDDKHPVVFLAAAQSLVRLGDPAGYDVYYEVLTGERKTKKGKIAKEEKRLKDPKMIAEMSIGEVVSINPFASLGWDVIKFAILDSAKKDPSPVKAAAAKMLADDPDPSTNGALLHAATGKNWIVQAAALDAIARRGDASLIGSITPLMTDDREAVRYTAAAAVIRLAGAPSQAGTSGSR